MFIAANASPCTDLAQIWHIVGLALLVFKIVIPIIIIIFGMIDLGKAVVASKDDEIKKSVKSLAFRAVAGIIIFLIPTLVGAIFKLVDGFQADPVKGEYAVCSKCISSPGSCYDTAKARCNEGAAEGTNYWDDTNKTCSK